MAAECGWGETAEPLIHVLDVILNGLSNSAKRLEAMPAG
jgi:hypothetical protein